MFQQQVVPPPPPPPATTVTSSAAHVRGGAPLEQLFQGTCLCFSSLDEHTVCDLVALTVVRGAEIHDSLTSAVTHLITARAGTAKYCTARQHQIACLHPQWILSIIESKCYVFSSAATSGSAELRDELFSRYFVKPMAGIKISTSTVPVGEMKTLEEKVRNSGGDFCGKLDETVTHLVISAPIPLSVVETVIAGGSSSNDNSAGGLSSGSGLVGSGSGVHPTSSELVKQKVTEKVKYALFHDIPIVTIEFISLMIGEYSNTSYNLMSDKENTIGKGNNSANFRCSDDIAAAPSTVFWEATHAVVKCAAIYNDKKASAIISTPHQQHQANSASSVLMLQAASYENGLHSAHSTQSEPQHQLPQHAATSSQKKEGNTASQRDGDSNTDAPERKDMVDAKSSCISSAAVSPVAPKNGQRSGTTATMTTRADRTVAASTTPAPLWDEPSMSMFEQRLDENELHEDDDAIVFAILWCSPKELAASRRVLIAADIRRVPGLCNSVTHVVVGSSPPFDTVEELDFALTRLRADVTDLGLSYDRVATVQWLLDVEKTIVTEPHKLARSAPANAVPATVKRDGKKAKKKRAAEANHKGNDENSNSSSGIIAEVADSTSISATSITFGDVRKFMSRTRSTFPFHIAAHTLRQAFALALRKKQQQQQNTSPTSLQHNKNNSQSQQQVPYATDSISAVARVRANRHENILRKTASLLRIEPATSPTNSVGPGGVLAATTTVVQPADVANGGQYSVTFATQKPHSAADCCNTGGSPTNSNSTAISGADPNNQPPHPLQEQPQQQLTNPSSAVAAVERRIREFLRDVSPKASNLFKRLRFQISEDFSDEFGVIAKAVVQRGSGHLFTANATNSASSSTAATTAPSVVVMEVIPHHTNQRKWRASANACFFSSPKLIPPKDPRALSSLQSFLEAVHGVSCSSGSGTASTTTASSVLSCADATCGSMAPSNTSSTNSSNSVTISVTLDYLLACLRNNLLLSPALWYSFRNSLVSRQPPASSSQLRKSEGWPLPSMKRYVKKETVGISVVFSTMHAQTFIKKTMQSCVEVLGGTVTPELNADVTTHVVVPTLMAHEQIVASGFLRAALYFAEKEKTISIVAPEWLEASCAAGYFVAEDNKYCPSVCTEYMASLAVGEAVKQQQRANAATAATLKDAGGVAEAEAIERVSTLEENVNTEHDKKRQNPATTDEREDDDIRAERSNSREDEQAVIEERLRSALETIYQLEANEQQQQQSSFPSGATAFVHSCGGNKVPSSRGASPVTSAQLPLPPPALMRVRSARMLNQATSLISANIATANANSTSMMLGAQHPQQQQQQQGKKAPSPTTLAAGGSRATSPIMIHGDNSTFPRPITTTRQFSVYITRGTTNATEIEALLRNPNTLVGSQYTIAPTLGKADIVVASLLNQRSSILTAIALGKILLHPDFFTYSEENKMAHMLANPTEYEWAKCVDKNTRKAATAGTAAAAQCAANQQLVGFVQATTALHKVDGTVATLATAASFWREQRDQLVQEASTSIATTTAASSPLLFTAEHLNTLAQQHSHLLHHRPFGGYRVLFWAVNNQADLQRVVLSGGAMIFDPAEFLMTHNRKVAATASEEDSTNSEALKRKSSNSTAVSSSELSPAGLYSVLHDGPATAVPITHIFVVRNTWEKYKAQVEGMFALRGATESLRGRVNVFSPEHISLRLQLRDDPHPPMSVLYVYN